MQALINHIEHIRDKINKASGAIVIIELKLRLLAEMNHSFRQEVYNQIKASKSGNDKKRNQYWNCELSCLTKSINVVVGDKLTKEQQEAVDSFKEPRDKILHGDFVALFKALGISLDGQVILAGGKRNQLVWPSSMDEAVKNQFLKQAICRFENNTAVTELNRKCTELNSLLDDLLNDRI